ncbi:MAG: penicillin-binding protein 2 [Rhodospirillales bacterium]|nr:penicillin-binding protein 2 [Rhodospirillales bacterium]|tara:strand:+ start:1495 stop:3357 length:1863 start_codon:yes stop_codon:yes gene_type:complete
MYREDSSRYKNFSRRALILGAGQVTLFGILAGRMYQLQVLESNRFRTLSDENRINLRLLAPLRGRIYDTFGKPLATNEENYRLLLVTEQVHDVSKTLQALSRLIEISDFDRKRILKESRKKKSFVPITIQENLDWKEVSQIEVNSPDLPGVIIDSGQRRIYPFGKIFSHLIGYVAPVTEKDKTRERKQNPLFQLPGFKFGKAGVEKRLDYRLRGGAGNSQLEVNAVGRVIRELSRHEGRPGDDVVLTIDKLIQNLAVEKLRDEKSAAAVVMKINNGEILALASVPGYDPNAFDIGMSKKEWEEISSDPLAPLINKAVAGLYAPGSTFKMVVAMAALEHGVITPNTKVHCKGHVELGNHRFHCWKKTGHGPVKLREAIQQSCDTYFYEIARQLGINKIAEMGRRFGLGKVTEIDLPNERSGLMPTSAWKKKKLGSAWQQGETLVAGIGQGFVLTTPLQLAVMTARIVSGREIKPKLIKAFISNGVIRELKAPKSKKIKILKSYRRIVMSGMDAVSNTPRGTGYRARIQDDEFDLAGKTGTVQVKSISQYERDTRVLKNRERPWIERDHALFVAFAPVKNPRYSIAVVVEHGGRGSTVAAPIARDILRATLKRENAKKKDLE